MIIPADYGQVNWRMGGSAAPLGAECTMGFWHENSALTATECAEALYGVWNDNIQDLQSTTLDLVSCLVKFGPNDTGPAAEFFDTHSGAQGASSFTPNVSILVKKITDSGGRAGRGRFFIPGFGEGSADESGAMDPTIQGNWQAAVDALLADMIALDLNPVVLHGEGSPLTAPSFINALVVDGRVATQRRRLRA